MRRAALGKDPAIDSWPPILIKADLDRIGQHVTMVQACVDCFAVFMVNLKKKAGTSVLATALTDHRTPVQHLRRDASGGLRNGW